MAIDTSSLDLKCIIEQVSGVRLSGPVGTGENRGYKSWCPFCKLGTDRFVVFQDCERPHFYCGVHGTGCGVHGDAIDFIRLYNNCSLSEACQFLQDNYGLPLDGVSLPKVKKNAITQDKAPSFAWQTRAVELVKGAVAFLWCDHESAKRARDYLHKRGLTDETMKRAYLGYFPGAYIKQLETWGKFEKRSEWGLPDEKDGNGKIHKHLFVPRGWVIPWFIDKQVWRVDIRRHPKDIQASEETAKQDKSKRPIGKYHRLSGSSDGLYGVNLIQSGKPLFVTESPLDALTGRQETPYIFVATGSTGGARHDPRWCEDMGCADPVVIAFDADKPGSEAFSVYWKKSLPDALRWLPWSHDVNQMKQDGQDIAEWASAGLEMRKAFRLDKNAQEEVIPHLPGNIDTQVSNAFPYGDPLGNQHIVSCSLSTYGLCTTQVIMQETHAWRMSPDGLVFCLECWQSRHLEWAERAHPYLTDQGLPTGLGERIERIMRGPGYACCGGYDWRVDGDGILVCHHVIEGREEIGREQQAREKTASLSTRTPTKR